MSQRKSLVYLVTNGDYTAVHSAEHGRVEGLTDAGLARIIRAGRHVSADMDRQRIYGGRKLIIPLYYGPDARSIESAKRFSTAARGSAEFHAVYSFEERAELDPANDVARHRWGLGKGMRSVADRIAKVGVIVASDLMIREYLENIVGCEEGDARLYGYDWMALRGGRMVGNG